ncbi:hypothetical protein LZ554_003518 [Drepanopeziza brunnea f. sp. 'monogermtubi']|nr:hypothetical protein LZ554_003518 [Drepanopeziza brunnea f. sp. 'monogermtubi']
MHLLTLCIRLGAAAALSSQVLAIRTTKPHTTKSHSSKTPHTEPLRVSTITPDPKSPTGTSSASASFPTTTSAYAHGNPLCAIPGFTVVPGSYNETIQQASGSTLKCCLAACVADDGDFAAGRYKCMSIAFNARYGECLFFDAFVEDTQLEIDASSEFVHYDLPCEVE